MTESYISLTPHDPVIARDSRPFGPGLRMKSLDWPHPSVVAGSMRTALGKMNGCDFSIATVKNLKEVSIHGPLPLFEGRLFFPKPLDILVKKVPGAVPETYPIRPAILDPDEGCDIPAGLLPAMLSKRAKDEFKPDDIAAFWSLEKMAEWLVNPTGSGFQPPYPPNPENVDPSDKTPQKKTEPHSSSSETEKDVAGLDLPGKESRFHTAIHKDHGVADESKFFETVGLDFTLKNRHRMMELAVLFEVPDGNPFNTCKFDGFGPLGAERRLAYWKSEQTSHKGWRCPDNVKAALEHATNVRMILATPAFFACGWLPGWLNERRMGNEKEILCGTPPGAPPDLKLGLVSACVERWRPLSGYCLEDEKVKPLRRIVPAGSVYFFKKMSGDAGSLAGCWLRPVSDDRADPRDQNSRDQFQKDGFGLALWGVWEQENNSGRMNQEGD